MAIESRKLKQSNQHDPLLVTPPDATAALDRVTLLRLVLCGDLSIDHKELKVPKSKLIFFVSSTFTDTHAERDEITNCVVPRLRALACGHGVEVAAVDLRYGIPDETTLMHTTWIDCSRELERCREESGGIFFISLQSEK
jgi:hypothetical protein